MVFQMGGGFRNLGGLVVVVYGAGVVLGSDFCFVDVRGGCVMFVCVAAGLGVRLFSYGLGILLCVVKGQDHHVGFVFCSVMS